jgi:hypothetical protein
MKKNLPITGTEHKLLADQKIISSTNLKGQISHINRDFLDISGFDETELLGSSICDTHKRKWKNSGVRICSL